MREFDPVTEQHDALTIHLGVLVFDEVRGVTIDAELVPIAREDFVHRAPLLHIEIIFAATFEKLRVYR